MSNIRKMLGCGLVVCAVMVASLPTLANTVAWWRFEEGTVGSYATSETTVVNSANPGALDGKAYVHEPNNVSLANMKHVPAELMPKYVESCYSGILDPVGGVVLSNADALHMTVNNQQDTVWAKGSTVLVEDNAALHLQTMTVECFVKVPSTFTDATDRFILAQRTDSSWTWCVKYTGNPHEVQVVFEGYDGGAKSTYYLDSLTNIEDGKWHHVAFTLNGENHAAVLYVDYVQKASCTFKGSVKYDNANSLMFGPHRNGYYGTFEHEIDEVRISDVALTVGQFLKMSPVSVPQTLGWWRFEEGVAGEWSTAETVVVNTANPGFLDGKAYVHEPENVSSANMKYVPADLMPKYVESFSPVFRVVDPVNGTSVRNTNAFHMATLTPTDTIWSKGSTVLIEDDEAMHLQNMTMECFVRIPTTFTDSTDRFIFAQRADSAWTWCVKYTGSPHEVQVVFESFSNGTKNTYYLDSLTNLEDDKWHHVAFTLDGANHVAKLYIDYVQKASANFAGVLDYTLAKPLMFGPYRNGYYGTFDHDIDEVRLSNYVLAPSQFLHAVPSSDLATADTLVLIDFEGGDRVDFAGQLAMPAFLNKALRTDSWSTLYATAYRPDYRSMDGSTWNTPVNNSAPLKFVSDVPAATVRDGVVTPEGVVDTIACQTVTNAPNNDWTDMVALKGGLTYQDLFADDVTVEATVKLPASGNVCEMDKYEIGIFTFAGGFYVNVENPNRAAGRGLLRCCVGSTWMSRPSGGQGYSAESITDGKWHHLAIVYKHALKRADFYIDGIQSLAADNIVFPASIPGPYVTDLVLGNGHYNWAYVTDVKYDNLRLTRAALKPYQFLTTRAVDASSCWATFDRDLLMGPYADLFPAPVVTGSVATDATQRPSVKILNGEDGEPVRPRNVGAVRFENGVVTYPSQALVAEQADATVEFFVKSPAATVGTGLVRLNRDESDPSGTASWALAIADNGLSVSVNTDAGTGEQTFAGKLDDGAWHHVAVSFAASGSDTVVTCYRDYVEVGTKTFAGRLQKGFDANLTLGASGFTGWIDELRVSPGVLTSPTFLWWKLTGFALFLR